MFEILKGSFWFQISRKVEFCDKRSSATCCYLGVVNL